MGFNSTKQQCCEQCTSLYFDLFVCFSVFKQPCGSSLNIIFLSYQRPILPLQAKYRKEGDHSLR